MNNIVVLGSSNTDLILRVQRLPGAGETLLGKEFLQAPGGKGANQAIAARRAGANVSMIGAVGDDAFGAARIQDLRDEGIDVRFVRTIAAVPSGVALIFVDAAGNNSIGVGPGANGIVLPEDVDEASDLFQSGSIFVTQWETTPEAVRAGLKLARSRDMITLFNAAPADPRVGSQEWLQDVSILVVNESEAAILLGRSLFETITPQDGERMAQELRGRGAEVVVVTLGSQGLLLVGSEITHIPGIEVDAIDTVAAGDTFVGALACRLAEGFDLLTSCRWANRAASIAVTRRGAVPSIPYRQEIEASVVRD